MTSDFRPMCELPGGHYATARNAAGNTFDIFCTPDRVMWNVRTGERLPGLTGWKKPPAISQAAEKSEGGVPRRAPGRGGDGTQRIQKNKISKKNRKAVADAA